MDMFVHGSLGYVTTMHMRVGHWMVNSYAAGGLFGQYKRCKTPFKMIETQAHGYSSWGTGGELSNECQHDRV